MLLIKTLIHYSLHLLFPGIIAYVWFRTSWKKAWLILVSTMLVDLDHLVANPIFDANRCSIDYHPLHSYYAIGIYILLIFPRKTRLIAIGLLFHMITDSIDCLFII